MSIKKKQIDFLSQEEKENIKKEQIKIIVDVLVDNLIEYDIDVSNNKIIDIILDLLKLEDSYGNRIIINDEDQIDVDSRDVFEKALLDFKMQVKDFYDSDFETINLIEEALDKIERGIVDYTFEYTKFMNIGKRQNNRFLCIPSINGHTVLHNDMIGKNSVVVISYLNANGEIEEKEISLSCPENVDLSARKDMVKHLLSELEKIESAFETSDNIAADFKQKSGCKGASYVSENGAYVKKSVKMQTRIQFSEYKGNILILGIYYKKAKGTNSNKNSKVQDEYEKRRMLACANYNMKELEQAYRDFKIELIKILYGGKISGIDALRRFCLEQIFSM